MSKLHEKFRAIYPTLKAESSGCVLWNGTIRKTGYGQIAVGNSRNKAERKLKQVHIIAHEHLQVGTPNDNIQDNVRDGRVPRGNQLPQARLTEDDVRRIRTLITQGLTDTQIAAQFAEMKLLRSTVWFIRVGRNWRHVS